MDKIDSAKLEAVKDIGPNKLEVISSMDCDNLKAIGELDVNKLSTQAAFLKAIKHQVAPILTQLINMTISRQFYPANLVEGRTIPVYKGKNKDKMTACSYREVTTVLV